jgi:hypothetical protein
MAAVAEDVTLRKARIDATDDHIAAPRNDVLGPKS